MKDPGDLLSKRRTASNFVHDLNEIEKLTGHPVNLDQTVVDFLDLIEMTLMEKAVKTWNDGHSTIAGGT